MSSRLEDRFSADTGRHRDEDEEDQYDPQVNVATHQTDDSPFRDVLPDNPRRQVQRFLAGARPQRQQDLQDEVSESAEQGDAFGAFGAAIQSYSVGVFDSDLGSVQEAVQGSLTVGTGADSAEEAAESVADSYTGAKGRAGDGYARAGLDFLAEPGEAAFTAVSGVDPETGDTDAVADAGPLFDAAFLGAPASRLGRRGIQSATMSISGIGRRIGQIAARRGGSSVDDAVSRSRREVGSIGSAADNVGSSSRFTSNTRASFEEQVSNTAARTIDEVTGAGRNLPVVARVGRESTSTGGRVASGPSSRWGPSERNVSDAVSDAVSGMSARVGSFGSRSTDDAATRFGTTARRSSDEGFDAATTFGTTARRTSDDGFDAATSVGTRGSSANTGSLTGRLFQGARENPRRYLRNTVLGGAAIGGGAALFASRDSVGSFSSLFGDEGEEGGPGGPPIPDDPTTDPSASWSGVLDVPGIAPGEAVSITANVTNNYEQPLQATFHLMLTFEGDDYHIDQSAQSVQPGSSTELAFNIGEGELMLPDGRYRVKLIAEGEGAGVVARDRLRVSSREGDAEDDEWAQAELVQTLEYGWYLFRQTHRTEDRERFIIGGERSDGTAIYLGSGGSTHDEPKFFDTTDEAAAAYQAWVQNERAGNHDDRDRPSESAPAPNPQDVTRDAAGAGGFLSSLGGGWGFRAVILLALIGGTYYATDGFEKNPLDGVL